MSPSDPLTATPVAPQSGQTSRVEPSLQLLGVTIVVPVYNELACVSLLMDTLVDLEVQLGDRFQFEFLLVDDGSDDGTPEMLEEMIDQRENFRVIQHQENKGIAAAIHTGILEARNEVVVSIDADGSYDALLIGEMVPRLTPEVDLVTASPYHPSGAVENVSPWRIVLSRLASAMYRRVMRSKLHCYTSCFRVYRRSVVLGLHPKNAGYVGVAELLWKLDRQGSQIVEHPAVLRVRLAGYSKLRIVRSTLNHICFMTQVARDRLRR